MRQVITNAIIIGLSVAFLAHFGMIIYYGSFLIQEGNPVILGAEVLLMVGFIAFAANNLKRIS